MAGYSGVDDHVDYITCNTAGNATDWGELNSSHSYRCAGGSDGSRGFCAGGAAGGSTISYLTIDTAGSSSNAGDMSFASWLIVDGERSPTNPVNKALFANKSANNEVINITKESKVLVYTNLF